MATKSYKIKYCPPPGDEKRPFLVDHVRIPPNEQITFHQHEALEVSYIIKGSGTRVIGNTMQAFAEGEIIFIPSDIPHCWSFDNFDTYNDGTIENISIFISPVLLNNVVNCFWDVDHCFSQILDFHDAVVYTGSTLRQLQLLMKSMTKETELEKFSSLIRLFGLIAAADDTSIVGNLIAEDRNTKRLQRAYSYVINNFQSEITLDDAAKFVGMDKSSFCTFFKKMTGRSFFTFLTNYRIESASEMLQKTNMSVAEICNAAGFNDVPHFNRVFKKVKQISPTQFRSVNFNKNLSLASKSNLLTNPLF